jgi:hypothetical protein
LRAHVHRAFAGTNEVKHTKVPSKVIAKLLLLSEQAKRIKSFLPEGADSLLEFFVCEGDVGHSVELIG